MNTKFSDGLREARIKAGMSQTELAEKAGLTQGAISSIELGRKGPSVDTFFRLCELLDIDPMDVAPTTQGYNLPQAA